MKNVSPTLAGLVLLVLGLLVAVLGYIETHGWCLAYIVRDFYSNVSTTLIGTAVVVLVIDRLSEVRARDALVRGLIRDMGSTDSGRAIHAAAELRVLGKMSDGTLDGADFSRAQLQGAPLEKLRARGGKFQGCQLMGADLAAADLGGAVLNRAILEHCNLEMGDLSRASCVEARFEEADLAGAVLTDADLSSASLRGADLRRADLRGVRLDAADLTEAELSGSRLGGAVGDAATTLPRGGPMPIAEGDSWRFPEGALWQ